jgi:hypothetical protein
MSTFLQLVQQTYRELGLTGPVPTTVIAQSNIRRKVVDWVAGADYAIQTLWSDWNFMWAQYSKGTEVGVANYAAPTDLARWDVDSFWIDYNTDDAQKLAYIKYKDWRETLRQGVLDNNLASLVTVLPDKSITLDVPADSASNTITADYWKKATKMSADASTSPIPVDLERIIICRAKLFYGEAYKDMEVLQIAGAEYNSILQLLEDRELPDRNDRMSQAPDMVIVVE